MKKSTAVVTGATGFIGSYVAKKLIDHGWRVVAIVREEAVNSKRLPRHKNMKVITGDLNDPMAWTNPLQKFQPKIFYHLAWTGVGNTDRNSYEQIKNISSSLATLKIAKEIGCTRWVSTGSQAEYGPVANIISETTMTQPTTAYGHSKLAVHSLSKLFGEQMGIEVTWLRIFSTYGPGDNSGWMLTDLIRALLKGESPMMTEGKQLWDYLYVEDAAEAIVLSGEHDKAVGTFNLGSGRVKTIREYAEIVKTTIDPHLKIQFGALPYRQDQVMHLQANIDKLTQQIGWSPRTDFEVGIQKTINWIRNNS